MPADKSSSAYNSHITHLSGTPPPTITLGMTELLSGAKQLKDQTDISFMSSSLWVNIVHRKL